MRALMPGTLHEFLSRDHARLDVLLASCRDAEEGIPYDSYDAFRRGLLWHIGVEEKLLFPELRKRGAGRQLELQLHRDHAALAALLVPPPTRVEIEQIAAILEVHNELEERDGGLYDVVEHLSASQLDALMQSVHALPEVRLVPNVDSPVVRESIARLMLLRQLP
jgi:hypothetical protein